VNVAGVGEPRVEPWGYVFGEPDCSLWVTGPAAPVIAILAESLRHERLRVKIAADGRSIRAKSWTAMLLNLANLLEPIEYLCSPVMTATVAEEGPPGTRIDITVRGGSSRHFRFVVPRALSAAVRLLEYRGMPVNVGPWERRPRRRTSRSHEMHDEQRDGGLPWGRT